MISKTSTATPSHRPRLLFLLLALFAASGCAALIYEIVWYQMLQFVIGATALSLTVLLAAFMGGMCLGSIVLPRMVTLRRIHPLRLYAAFELGIGVCGVLSIYGMPLLTQVYLAGVNHGFPAILLRAVICSVCLLLPAMFMGASLPALARWITTVRHRGRWLGFFYGANTAGAVLGCLFAGFYLLRVFDMSIATYTAVSINVLIAIMCLAVSLRVRPREVAAEPEPLRMQSSSSAWPVHVSIALSGACALGAEVVWTRLLSLILGATVYTFSIVLAVFLMGIALGSGLGSFLSSFVCPRKALACCQWLLTALVTATAVMLAKSVPYWPPDAVAVMTPWTPFKTDLLRAVWVILPPALLWGASLPLAIAAVASLDEDPARPVAGIYASNTAGSIVGAICVSMLLIPHVGTRDSQRVLVLLSAISALCLLVPRVRTPSLSWRPTVRTFALSAALAAVGFLVLAVPAVPGVVIAYGRLAPKAGKSRILYAGEGLNSSIAVSQLGGKTTFHVSGKVEASTGSYDMRMQRMLGDVPALLHADPRSVLVVGFGAGVTAGAFAVNPDVRQITICEIEPLVPLASTRYFKSQNYDVLHDGRTELVYDDARSYVLTTHQTFDVITSDPIHPWVKGSAALYTKEYFELVKQRLNPGGVVAQWVPMYQTDLQSVKTELATFFDVFPDGTLWVNQGDGQSYDLVLIGQSQPAPIDVDGLQRRLDQPRYGPVRDSLRAVGLGSAVSILGTYAGRGRDLKQWLKGAQINRDGNLRLQYLAGLAVNAGVRGQIAAEILSYRRFPDDLLQGSPQYLQALRKALQGSSDDSSGQLWPGLAEPWAELPGDEY